MRYDVAVVGLGAMGSAAAYHASARGATVIGYEAGERAHPYASSGGLSRIIRLAYFEHPSYVPLLRRAWDLWRDLERATGRTLLHATGGLYTGPADGELVSGARRSARAHGLAHEMLDADGIRARFPALAVDDGWVGLYEEQAGWLAPERAIDAHLAAAERHGAVLRFGERAALDGVAADRVVVTAGAWTGRHVPRLAPHLRVERVPLFWFEPAREVGPLPVWIMDTADGAYYGFPPDEHGLKVARHGDGDATDPDRLDRSHRPADEARIRAFLRRHLPAGDGPLRSSHVCMYTRTPDGHFVIDREGDRLVYASACSGHGFKFASVVGEILADLALGGVTRHDIAFLSASRLSGYRERDAAV
ncbi:MAG TPA: N-methyl-L-tryptophan oxidase [Candidatus Limnocylindria bacterium]|nr:N-methyl-L-tryptophan oxidase [Candidatus Limnocylindria bacterium]